MPYSSSAMPPLKDALLKLQLLTAPHHRLRQVAFRVLSLDRKCLLHPNLSILITLHSAFDTRLRSFQYQFTNPQLYLPDDVLDMVLKELCYLPRIVSVTTEGLNAIANVLSTPSFKGLPTRYSCRIRAFCIHVRLAIRTLDRIKALFGEAMVTDFASNDEDANALRGLLDIVTVPGEEKVQVRVEGRTKGDCPWNRSPYYTAYVCYASKEKKIPVEIMKRKLEARGIRTFVRGYCESLIFEGKEAERLENVLETADVGVFILSPEFEEEEVAMEELKIFLRRRKEGAVLIPVFYGLWQGNFGKENTGRAIDWVDDVWTLKGISAGGEGSWLGEVIERVLQVCRVICEKGVDA